MKTLILLPFVLMLSVDCSDNQGQSETINQDPDTQITNDQDNVGCPNATYTDWKTSEYVLPYPVGKSYRTDLSQCSGSYHSEGQPDQFATDFNMNIGTIVTSSREGTVVHTVESGNDYEFPNNIVIVKHSDGTFAQYMHLTKNGAIVEVGEVVAKGDTLGKSGATGLAGYPHLHFVVTSAGNWNYPYISVPHNFSNTDPNPHGLKKNTFYGANPY